MALIVLDASILIAHLDAHDRFHEAAGAALREHDGDDLRAPASAYSEALVDPARRGVIDRARADLEALEVRVEPLDASVAERAAVLRARAPHLRLPDALVIASGDTLGAEAVLTTDRRWAGFPRVRVVA